MPAADPIADRELAGLFAGLEQASGVALAVSGGADSLALMLLVARWRTQSAVRVPLVVLTVDHGLRPGSAEEAAKVVGWAAMLGLPHATLTRGGPALSANLQARARTARYRLLAAAAQRQGLSHLVTAHHLDDQAETFLLRLARGSGLKGLAGMARETRLALGSGPTASRATGIILARPLLSIAKARLVATCRAAGLAWIEDPSNEDRRFSRARIRALTPLLAAEGLTAARLAETARLLARAQAAIEAAVDDLFARAASREAEGLAFDVAALAAAPEEVGLRALARALGQVGGFAYPPRHERLEALMRAVRDPAAMRFRRTLAGCLVERREGQLCLSPEPARGKRTEAAHAACEPAPAPRLARQGRQPILDQLPVEFSASGGRDLARRSVSQEGDR